MNDLVKHCHEVHRDHPMPEGATHIDVSYTGRSSWEKLENGVRYFFNQQLSWAELGVLWEDGEIYPIPIDFLLDIYEEPAPKDKVWGSPVLQNMLQLKSLFEKNAKPLKGHNHVVNKEVPVIPKQARYAGDWRNQYANNAKWGNVV